MTQQKAFYEIEKPNKKTYVVIVQELEKEEEEFCLHLDPIYDRDGHEIDYMHMQCSTREYWNGDQPMPRCTVCGRAMCSTHLNSEASKKLDPHEWICVECAPLPSDVRSAIQLLRWGLNNGR